MAETRTYQGATYTRNSPSEPWVLVPQGGPQPITIGTPDPAASLGLPAAQADLQNTQSTIADRATDNARADAALVAELYSKGMQLGPNGQPEPIPGWVKPGEGAGALTAEMRGTAMNQYGTLANLAAGVNDLRQQFEDNFQGANPLEGFGNAELLGIPIGAPFREQDRIFNDRSGALTAFIATALGLSGQQFNTPAEQKLFIQSILPKAGDTDGQIEAKLGTLDELILTARNKGKATLGYTDETDPLLADPNFNAFVTRTGGPPPLPGGSALDRVRIGNTAQTQTAGFGATQGQTATVPPELNAEHDALVARMMQQGGGRIDPDAYGREMAAISAKYPGFESPPEVSAQWARDMNAYLEAGGKTIPGGVQIQDRPLSTSEWIRNSVVDNPVGSAFTGAMNAGGFGIPSLLAPEGFDALRESRPASQMIGEIGGGVTGTAMAGKLLGAGAGMVGRESIAELLSNPMLADMAYGAAYGATQGEDPLSGMAIGAGGSLLGSLGGSAFGKAAPRLTGVGGATDTLNPGERMVFDATNRTGRDEVAAALTQAGDLGVPASLADVSPGVNSLTGAAMRRSPDAAGPASEALIARGRGQYDRLLGAVERDLGPIENIPQRSEDLITQARADAAPLYDTAYAAPGVDELDLTDLLQRPSMQAALVKARRIALEEGRNPDELGFVLNDAGEVTLGDAGRYAESRGPRPSHEASVISGAHTPRDLVSFVRASGGLRDTAGELRFIDANNKPRRGVPLAGQDQKLGRMVDNDNGRSFDEMAEAAWEAGYFGPPSEVPRPTEREFLEALEDTYKGTRRTFSFYDDETVNRYFDTKSARQEWERDAGMVEDLSEPAGPDQPFMPPEAMGSMSAIAPSWQTLDYVKRGLDDVLESYRDKTTGKLVLDTEGRAVNDTLRQFLGRVDTANPDYAAARAAYAGPAQERAAMQRGQEALRMSPNQLGVNMGNASESQAGQMRLGFQSGLAEQAGRVRSSTNPFDSVLGTPAMEQRLAAMGYGQDEVARLLAQRDLERQVAGSTNRLIGNSASAERILADEAFGAESSVLGTVGQGVAETLITGAPVATALRTGAGRGMRQRLGDWRTLGIGEKARTAADQIIPLALEMDPAAAEAALSELATRDDSYQVIVQELMDQARRRGAIGGAGLSSVIAAELAR
jgi:hypothetical protein